MAEFCLESWIFRLEICFATLLHRLEKRLTEYYSKPIRVAEGIEIPTDDELEPEETEPPVKSKKPDPKRLSSFYNDGSVEIENLDPDFVISVSPPNTPATTTRPKSSKSPAQPRSPLVIAAGELADSYRSSRPKNKVPPASLRCYFLWYHNTDLSLPDIAALLRVGHPYFNFVPGFVVSCALKLGLDFPLNLFE